MAMSDGGIVQTLWFHIFLFLGMSDIVLSTYICIYPTCDSLMIYRRFPEEIGRVEEDKYYSSGTEHHRLLLCVVQILLLSSIVQRAWLLTTWCPCQPTCIWRLIGRQKVRITATIANGGWQDISDRSSHLVGYRLTRRIICPHPPECTATVCVRCWVASVLDQGPNSCTAKWGVVLVRVGMDINGWTGSVWLSHREWSWNKQTHPKRFP